MLDLSTSGSTSTQMMCKVITIFKKLMSTFFLNWNFACQIKMMYISFVNLRVTEMTEGSLTYM